MLVSIREFKAHLSRYIAEARAGAPVEITSHRKVVARVIGVPGPAATGVEKLIASGAAEWQAPGRPAGASIVLQREDAPLADLVLEQRG